MPNYPNGPNSWTLLCSIVSIIISVSIIEIKQLIKTRLQKSKALSSLKKLFLSNISINLETLESVARKSASAPDSSIIRELREKLNFSLWNNQQMEIERLAPTIALQLKEFYQALHDFAFESATDFSPSDSFYFYSNIGSIRLLGKNLLKTLDPSKQRN